MVLYKLLDVEAARVTELEKIEGWLCKRSGRRVVSLGESGRGNSGLNNTKLAVREREKGGARCGIAGKGRWM